MRAKAHSAIFCKHSLWWKEKNSIIAEMKGMVERVYEKIFDHAARTRAGDGHRVCRK